MSSREVLIHRMTLTSWGCSFCFNIRPRLILVTWHSIAAGTGVGSTRIGNLGVYFHGEVKMTLAQRAKGRIQGREKHYGLLEDPHGAERIAWQALR